MAVNPMVMMVTMLDVSNFTKESFSILVLNFFKLSKWKKGNSDF